MLITCDKVKNVIVTPGQMFALYNDFTSDYEIATIISIDNHNERGVNQVSFLRSSLIVAKCDFGLLNQLFKMQLWTLL